MKVREGFMLRKIADVHVVVPVGESSIDFNGIITLNETAAFLFQQLLEGTSKERLLEELLQEYDIDQKSAQSDIEDFCGQLREAGLIA